MAEGFRDVINCEEAIRLKARGMKWKDVGIMLARELKRDVPFQESSVAGAVSKFRKERENAK